MMALELGLTGSPMSWHNQRDEWVALGCELGLLTGSLGKIARDIALMSQFEVGELAENQAPDRGGPSNMPHKHNPVACMVSIAASQRVPQRVAALTAAMPQEHERGLGNWQAELAEWPQLLISAHGSARAMGQALASLMVFDARMRRNLDSVRASLPKATADEWFNPELVHHAAALSEAQRKVLSQDLQQ